MSSAKKNIFDLNFDPSKAASYSTRNRTMSGFLGEGKINTTYPKIETQLSDKRDLRQVFKSQQVPQLLPSHYTKVKKGQ